MSAARAHPGTAGEGPGRRCARRSRRRGPRAGRDLAGPGLGGGPPAPDRADRLRGAVRGGRSAAGVSGVQMHASYRALGLACCPAQVSAMACPGRPWTSSTRTTWSGYGCSCCCCWRCRRAGRGASPALRSLGHVLDRGTFPVRLRRQGAVSGQASSPLSWSCSAAAAAGRPRRADLVVVLAAVRPGQWPPGAAVLRAPGALPSRPGRCWPSRSAWPRAPRCAGSLPAIAATLAAWTGLAVVTGIWLRYHLYAAPSRFTFSFAQASQPSQQTQVGLPHRVRIFGGSPPRAFVLQYVAGQRQGPGRHEAPAPARRGDGGGPDARRGRPAGGPARFSSRRRLTCRTRGSGHSSGSRPDGWPSFRRCCSPCRSGCPAARIRSGPDRGSRSAGWVAPRRVSRA